MYVAGGKPLNVDRSSISFFIGAATTGEGEGKWSWPGRDLKFLYERKYQLNTSASIEPDLETWKRFGMAVMRDVDDDKWMSMAVKDLCSSVGDELVMELLQHTRGTYLSESRDKILDWLGCPRDTDFLPSS